MNRILVILAMFFSASCSQQQPTKKVLRDELHGINLVVEHLEGPALSRSEDRVLVNVGGDSKVIFEGYGGAPLTLKSLRSGVIIISYCGGSIRSTESFLLDHSGEAVAVRVQPVIAAGVQIDGQTFCGTL